MSPSIYSTTLMVDKKSNCEKYEAELLLLGAKPVDWDAYPKLKYVFRAGVGCDNIDVYDIRVRNLKLFFPSERTRKIISEAVAHLAFGWIMAEGAMDRRIHEWYREPRRGRKRICVVGACGNIGSLVYSLCDGLLLEVIPSDPKDPSGEYVGWGSCDIITFHIPLETYEVGCLYRNNVNFVNSEFLSKLKPTVTLINTSRGKIANEYDIAAFLQENPQAKYITDVYNEEPYTKENPLDKFYMTQFFGSPHIASYTYDVREALTKDVSDLLMRLE